MTLAEAFNTQGYDTALFGKWHHGQPRDGSKTYVHPMDQGFDEFFGFTDAKHAWEKYPEKLWHGRELKPVSGYSDDLFADHAIASSTTEAEAVPFFLYVPFTNATSTSKRLPRKSPPQRNWPRPILSKPIRAT